MFGYRNTSSSAFNPDDGEKIIGWPNVSPAGSQSITYNTSASTFTLTSGDTYLINANVCYDAPANNQHYAQLSCKSTVNNQNTTILGLTPKSGGASGGLGTQTQVSLNMVFTPNATNNVIGFYFYPIPGSAKLTLLSGTTVSIVKIGVGSREITTRRLLK